MREINFGSLSGRHLSLRLRASDAFNAFTPTGFHLSPWRLLNPQRWYYAIFRRYNWKMWWRWYSDMNHRCYCPCGRMFDGRICLAGFSVTWFYSHFTGELPCSCDELFERLVGEGG